MSKIEWCLIKEVEDILKNPKKEKSDDNPVKAYKLTICAPDKDRTVVSAIADLFSKDQLLGFTTTFELDLPPKEIRGFISEGMIVLNETDPNNLQLNQINFKIL